MISKGSNIGDQPERLESVAMMLRAAREAGARIMPNVSLYTYDDHSPITSLCWYDHDNPITDAEIAAWMIATGQTWNIRESSLKAVGASGQKMRGRYTNVLFHGLEFTLSFSDVDPQFVPAMVRAL